MKVKSFVKEGDISHSLDMRRMAKKAMGARNKRQEEQAAKAQMFSQIDRAVAATLDFLVGEKGMDQEEAEKMVYSHLSDLAMMHDLS